MKTLLARWALVSVTAAILAQTPVAIKTGPEVGTPVPSFAAVDQNGVRRTLNSILRQNGALLVFFRSADW